MSRTCLLFGLLFVGFYHVALSDHMVQAPRYTVNLDNSPEARWNDVISHWNVTDVKTRIEDAIE